MAYVADGTGHAKDKKTFERYEGFWNKFNSAVSELPKPTSKEESLDLLKKFVVSQSPKYLERGCGGTLTITQLFIDQEGKKHLIHVSIGDSDLYCLRKNGELERIVPIDHSARNGNFEGDLRVEGVIHCGFTVVEAGDKIVGVTDGITDFMSDNVLKSVLTHNDTTPSNLIEKLFDKLISGNTGGSKKLDRNDSHGGSDDISAFMMIVPEK